MMCDLTHIMANKPMVVRLYIAYSLMGQVCGSHTGRSRWILSHPFLSGTHCIGLGIMEDDSRLGAGSRIGLSRKIDSHLILGGHPSCRP